MGAAGLKGAPDEEVVSDPVGCHAEFKLNNNGDGLRNCVQCEV